MGSTLLQRRAATVTAALALLVGVPAAQAHLMAAQRGTLNLVSDGAYVVLSLPASAFTGADDDGDGQLSPRELARHRTMIIAAIQRGIRLRDAAGARPFELASLALSPPDDAPDGPAPQVLVLGRFALGSDRTSLRLECDLFGRQDTERELRVSITQAGKPTSRVLLLQPGQRSQSVAPSAWQKLVSWLQRG